MGLLILIAAWLLCNSFISSNNRHRGYTLREDWTRYLVDYKEKNKNTMSKEELEALNKRITDIQNARWGKFLFW